jgi:hypothetical protein
VVLFRLEIERLAPSLPDQKETLNSQAGKSVGDFHKRAIIGETGQLVKAKPQNDGKFFQW